MFTYFERVESTGCPTKHDSRRIVLNVFFYIERLFAVYLVLKNIFYTLAIKLLPFNIVLIIFFFIKNLLWKKTFKIIYQLSCFVGHPVCCMQELRSCFSTPNLAMSVCVYCVTKTYLCLKGLSAKFSVILQSKSSTPVSRRYHLSLDEKAFLAFLSISKYNLSFKVICRFMERHLKSKLSEFISF